MSWVGFGVERDGWRRIGVQGIGRPKLVMSAKERGTTTTTRAAKNVRPKGFHGPTGLQNFANQLPRGKSERVGGGGLGFRLVPST